MSSQRELCIMIDELKSISGVLNNNSLYYYNKIVDNLIKNYNKKLFTILYNKIPENIAIEICSFVKKEINIYEFREEFSKIFNEENIEYLNKKKQRLVSNVIEKLEKELNRRVIYGKSQNFDEINIEDIVGGSGVDKSTKITKEIKELLVINISKYLKNNGYNNKYKIIIRVTNGYFTVFKITIKKEPQKKNCGIM